MIRKINKSDIASLLRIEQAIHVAPWSEDTFKLCFQAGYFGWLIEEDITVIGFIIIAENQDECHILNLAVALAHQRRGYGQQLLTHVLHYAKQRGIWVVYLEVRRSNTRALALYKKMNFAIVGERKNYYPTVTGHEDALILALNLKGVD